MRFIIIHKAGNVSISKIIEAPSKDEAIDIFIKDYDAYDITKNDIDVFFHDDIKNLVKYFFENYSVN